MITDYGICVYEDGLGREKRFLVILHVTLGSL
jgi:hypothetical protein